MPKITRKPLAPIFGSIITAKEPQPCLDVEYNEFCKKTPPESFKSPNSNVLCPFCKNNGYYQKKKGESVEVCKSCLFSGRLG